MFACVQPGDGLEVTLSLFVPSSVDEYSTPSPYGTYYQSWVEVADVFPSCLRQPVYEVVKSIHSNSNDDKLPHALINRLFGVSARTFSYRGLNFSPHARYEGSFVCCTVSLHKLLSTLGQLATNNETITQLRTIATSPACSSGQSAQWSEQLKREAHTGDLL